MLSRTLARGVNDLPKNGCRRLLHSPWIVLNGDLTSQIGFWLGSVKGHTLKSNPVPVVGINPIDAGIPPAMVSDPLSRTSFGLALTPLSLSICLYAWACAIAP